MNPRTIAIFAAAGAVLIAAGIIALRRPAPASWLEPDQQPRPRDAVGWPQPPRPNEAVPLRLPKAVSIARPRLDAPQLIETSDELRAILAPAVPAAHLGCQRLGSFLVSRRAPSTVQLRLSACRGTAAGCSGSGGNWLLVRTCRSGGGADFEGCTDTPVFTTYGHFSVSRPIDVSAAFTGTGTYTSYLCDAGCATPPSESYGPCCNPASCQACMSPVETHCPAMYTADHSYGHLDWVEYRLR